MINKLPISLCCVAFNEEKRIKEFVERHAEYFNEIIICTNGSTDNTSEILSTLSVTVIPEKYRGLAENSRHLCALKSTNNWILFLDADEFATQNLLDNLSNLISGDYTGYLLERNNYCDGVLNSKECNQYRLFKKTAVIFNTLLHSGIEPLTGSHITEFYNAIDHIKTSQENIIDAGIYDKIILNAPEAVSPFWYLLYQARTFPLEQMLSMVVTSSKPDITKLNALFQSYDTLFDTEKLNKILVCEINSDSEELRDYCSDMNVQLIVPKYLAGQYRLMLEGTMRVGTPFYLYTNDDCYASRDVNLSSVINEMSENISIKRVNFHNYHLVVDKFNSILTPTEGRHINYCRTSWISTQTHVSHTFLANYIYGRRIRELGLQCLEESINKEYRQYIDMIGFNEAFKLFGSVIYGEIYSPPTINRLF